MRAQVDAKNWNQLIGWRRIGANFDDSYFSDVEASAEVDDGEGILNEGLSSGSERDLIEYYFNRGLTYRQITLMLGKHHRLDMNERTLKRRLKDYGLRRRGVVNDEFVERVKDLIMLEICTGPNGLSGYRTILTCPAP